MMKLGVEVFFEAKTTQYTDKKIGLLTNLTGVNQQLQSTIDLFAEHEGLQLTALFGPEHGIRGVAQEGQAIGSSVDPYTNVPVHSLYTKDKTPNTDILRDVDIVFCDLQDIGSRYYTFIYTMADLMKLCKKEMKPFVVLDRPNPINGNVVEGNVVQENCRSFVGQYPIPVRHGLTIGELASLFNEEFSIHCDLEVVPMTGWERDMFFEDTGLHWVSPTPNVTNIDMCLLYPGTCLIEGTNISEGRGTTKPFEMIGAPFVNGRELAAELSSYQLPGILFRPAMFQPMHQKFAGEVCEGVQLHISNRQALQSYSLGLHLLKAFQVLYPEEFAFIRSEDFNNRYFIDLLTGTEEVRELVLKRDTATLFSGLFDEVSPFRELRKPYLLY